MATHDDSDLVGGWTKFLETLKTDQDMQMALLGFGTQLLNSEGDRGFGANVSSAFLNSSQFLQQSRAGRAKEEEDRKEKEAELDRQKVLDKDALDTGQVTRDLRKAQAENTRGRTAQIGKTPPRQETVSDLTRRADALMETDPSITTRSEAIVKLGKDKGKVTREEFIADFLQRNEIMGTTATQAADAWLKHKEALKLSTPGGPTAREPVTAAELKGLYPHATAKEIADFLSANDPEALAELEILRAQ